MFEAILSAVSAFFQVLPFSGATWLVLAMILLIIWLFSKAHKDANGLVKWTDLIVDPEINRASPYKLGYLIGMIVGTWIVISLADKASLSFDILGLYLSYLLGGAGWSEFVHRKTKLPTPDQYDKPNRTRPMSGDIINDEEDDLPPPIDRGGRHR